MHLLVGTTVTGSGLVGSGLITGVGAIGSTTVFNDISGQKMMPIGLDRLVKGKLTQP